MYLPRQLVLRRHALLGPIGFPCSRQGIPEEYKQRHHPAPLWSPLSEDNDGTEQADLGVANMLENSELIRARPGAESVG